MKVIYVGRKASAIDNVAGSRKTWNGYGDVHEVTEQQARILTKYPDQWTLEDAKDQKALDVPQTHAVTDNDGNVVQVDAAALTKPLEKMTKPELVALAKEQFGKDLDPASSKKRLIDAIEELLKNGV